MNRFLYGIDFGTSNSALSIYDEQQQGIIATLSVPSLIYFPEKENPSAELTYVIGEEAITEYLKDGMKGRFIKSVKQILSRTSFVETRIHNKRYNASDLVSLILKDLKNKADELIGYDCRKAVIGRPVFFDDENAAKDTLAQTRLAKAAEIAGFTELRFQFEPIGAAFAYEKTIDRPEKVLVADLGGGTTDFTCLILDPENANKKDRKNDMIASGGIYIGGDSFDAAFMWEKGTPYFGKNTEYEGGSGKVLTVPVSLFANICSWEQMNFFNNQRIRRDMETYYHYSKKDPKFKNLLTLVDHNLGYSVFQSIEKTKLALSTQKSSLFEYHNMGIEIDETITIGQYESIIAKDIQKINNYLNGFLLTHNITAEDIDTLFITGGSSQVGAVQDFFKTRFPSVRINSGDNFTSVAKGLALSGYLFTD